MVATSANAQKSYSIFDISALMGRLERHANVHADLPDWLGIWVLPLNPSHWALNAVHYDCRVANDSHSEL